MTGQAVERETGSAPGARTARAWLGPVRLGDVSGSRDNNFNLIRMIAAAAVLVSHAWPITLGAGAVEPLEHALGRSLGWCAVAVFFAISGFLIARSWEHSAGIADWTAARVLRLFPGLAVVLALTVLVLGPLTTTLPVASYAVAPDTASYWPRNMSLVFLQWGLPGVFETNPAGGGINGSLWSLQYEVGCYVGVLAAGLMGLLRPGWGAVAVFAVYAVFRTGVWWAEMQGIALQDKIPTFAALSLPFAIGMALYVWRDRVPLGWLPAAGLCLLALALRPTPLFEPAFMAALSYATFCLAYLPGGALRAYNRLGDYSYGVYIYAFPAQQWAVWMAGAMSPAVNIAVALPVTLVFAVLSWHLVEKPSLALKRRFRRQQKAG